MPLFFSSFFRSHGRSRHVCWVSCVSLSLGAGMAFCGQPALASSHRQSMAAYARAETVQRRLEAKPISERTREDYERALDAYRAVYHSDPASPDAARSIAAVADLLASEGRCFHDAKLFHDAVAQWEFLRQQYPTSPLRQRALFEQAAIEQRDLHNRAAAKKIYRSFLTHYPQDALAEQARAGLRGETASPMAEERPLVAKKRPEISAGPMQPVETASTATLPPHAQIFPKPTFSTAATVATIQGVRYWEEGSSTRLAVDMSAAAPYRAYLAQNGRQITLIFFGAQPAASLLAHSIAVQRDANLRSVRVSVLTGEQTELFLELNREVSFSSFVLTNPQRLILDLRTSAGATTALALAGIAKPARPQVFASRILRTQPANTVGQHETVRTSPAILPESTPTAAPTMTAEPTPGLAAEPTTDGQCSMMRVLGLRVRRIVIDAGHGGHDSGTLGPGGVEEKDIALDVALRLGHLLQQRLGAQVIYTRRTDKFVPLEERTAIANQAHADLFLSIHANSSPDPDARGVETYFLNFTASPDALAVAARENAVSDRSVHELSDLVRKIALSDKIDESREFAGDVNQSLYTGLASGNPGLKNRGVKQAPFVVLIGANMPSILAEISFLTNPQDAEELSQPAYRERLAEALYRGVTRYVDGMSGIRVAKTAPQEALPARAE